MPTRSTIAPSPVPAEPVGFGRPLSSRMKIPPKRPSVASSAENPIWTAQ